MRIPNTDLTTSDPFFKCPLCEYSTFMIRCLTNHIEKKHSEHYVGVKRY